MSVNQVGAVSNYADQAISNIIASGGVPTQDAVAKEMARLQAEAAQKAQQNDLTMLPKEPEEEVIPTTYQLGGHLDNLERTKTSGDTIEMQKKAEQVKQAILKEAQTLELGKVKDLPDNNAKASVINEFIAVAVKDQEVTESNAKALANIADTHLTDKQKEALGKNLEKIKSQNFSTLCAEFGITVDFSQLKPLGAKATPEDVATQLKAVEDILAQINGSDGKEPTGLAKVRAERKAADDNIAHNNKTIKHYEDLYANQIKIGELKEGDPNPYQDKITALQEANLTALQVVAKADSLLAMVEPVVGKLNELKTTLTTENENLTNIATFDAAAEKRKAEQIKQEDATLAQAQKDEAKAKEKRNKMVTKMGEKKSEDTDLTRYNPFSDEVVQGKVDKKYKKAETRQKAVETAIKDKNTAQEIVDTRNAKQKELDKLRGIKTK